MTLKTTTGGAIKYTVELHRKDGVSEEAFMHWFTDEFLPAAVPIMKKHNILKYAVQKTDLKVGAALQPGRKVNDCDLVLECWVYDLESLKSLASDPEWIQTALEDENDWLATSRSTIRIGYYMIYSEYAGIMDVTGQKRRSRVSASFD